MTEIAAGVSSVERATYAPSAIDEAKRNDDQKPHHHGTGRLRADGTGEGRKKKRSSTGFIKLPSRLFDLGVAAAINPRTFLIYCALLRYVWRSPTKGHEKLRRLYSKGTLVARISQRRLAAFVGLRRRASVMPHLRKLEGMGWIRSVAIVPHHSLGYVVGEKRNERESFFLHDWLDHLERTGRTPEERAQLARAWVRGSTGHPVCGAADMPRTHGADTEKREPLEGEKYESRRTAEVDTMRGETWVVRIRRSPRGRDLMAAGSDDVRQALAIYAQCWELRFKHAFVAMGKTRLHLEELVRRVGLDEARRAIEVILLEPRCGWVNNHSNALANPKFYDKFVAPLLGGVAATGKVIIPAWQERARGEQAEWRGGRDGDGGLRTPEEFWR